MMDVAFDLKQYLTEKREMVEAALLARLMPSTPESRVDRAMAHSLNAGGKRIRPILCMAAAEALGKPSATCLDAACALEMIHTYSLIHDDLPAMDDDDLRRGLPTCHKAFDEATAILAGDALLTQAFRILALAGRRADDSRLWLDVISDVALASGHHGMILGQMIDMDSEGKTLSLETLEDLHRKKTGALIRVSVLTGALLAGADKGQMAQLADYAEALGLAFQVTDDLLDITGDPERIGKPVGSDIANHKATYPALLGVAEARNKADMLIKDALSRLEPFGTAAEPLRALARYVRDRRR